MVQFFATHWLLVLVTIALVAATAVELFSGRKVPDSKRFRQGLVVASLALLCLCAYNAHDEWQWAHRAKAHVLTVEQCSKKFIELNTSGEPAPSEVYTYFEVKEVPGRKFRDDQATEYQPGQTVTVRFLTDDLQSSPYRIRR